MNLGAAGVAVGSRSARPVQMSIAFPQLWLMRGVQACVGMDLSNLGFDKVQLGLEAKPKWHHITYTKTKEGRPCYRVRVCKTCAQQKRIELGTYCDLESALLVNDVYELLQGRTKLLNVLCTCDIPFVSLLHTRKLDRGKVLVYTMEQIFRQMGLNLPSVGQKDWQTNSSTSEFRSSPVSVIVKRKRSGSESSSSILRSVSSFELDATSVLSRVLQTQEAGSLFGRHCVGRFANGSPEDVQRAVLAQLTGENQPQNQDVIHPLLANVTFQMLLYGKTDIPTDHVERIVSVLRSRNLSKSSTSPWRSLLLHDESQRSILDENGDAMRILMSYVQLPKTRIMREVAPSTFVDRAIVVMKELYIRTYEMCLFLKMPLAAPRQSFLDEKLEAALHVCERKVRTLSKVCAALQCIEQAFNKAAAMEIGVVSTRPKFSELKAQIAECVVWYCLLHTSISLRLQVWEGPSHIEMLDDSLTFLRNVQADQNFQTSQYDASHQIMILGSQMLVACTKIRTLRHLDAGVCAAACIEQDSSEEYRMCEEVGQVLNRMASLGFAVGYVPVSTFAMLCSMMDAGVPSVDSFRNLFVFEAALIFYTSCLEVLHRVSDPALIPEFTRTHTDINPVTLIHNILTVLTRMTGMCNQAKYACLLSESLLCLKLVVEIMCCDWAQQFTAQISGLELGAHQTSMWAETIVFPDGPVPPGLSPYECVSSVNVDDPCTPVCLRVAHCALSLLQFNAQRYRYASMLLCNLGFPITYNAVHFGYQPAGGESSDFASHSEGDDSTPTSKRIASSARNPIDDLLTCGMDNFSFAPPHAGQEFAFGEQPMQLKGETFDPHCHLTDDRDFKFDTTQMQQNQCQQGDAEVDVLLQTDTDDMSGADWLELELALEDCEELPFVHVQP